MYRKFIYLASVLVLSSSALFESAYTATDRRQATVTATTDETVPFASKEAQMYDTLATQFLNQCHDMRPDIFFALGEKYIAYIAKGVIRRTRGLPEDTNNPLQYLCILEFDACFTTFLGEACLAIVKLMADSAQPATWQDSDEAADAFANTIQIKCAEAILRKVTTTSTVP